MTEAKYSTPRLHELPLAAKCSKCGHVELMPWLETRFAEYEAEIKRLREEIDRLEMAADSDWYDAKEGRFG